MPGLLNDAEPVSRCPPCCAQQLSIANKGALTLHAASRSHTMRKDKAINTALYGGIHCSASLTAAPLLQEANGNKLSYVVLPGNESILMSDAMSKRSWWKAVEKGTPNNFWWGGNGQRFGWQDFQQGRRTAPIRCILAVPELQGVLMCRCQEANSQSSGRSFRNLHKNQAG